MATLSYLLLKMAIGSPNYFSALVVVILSVLFIAMLVSNRIIYRRVRKRMKKSEFTNTLIKQALKDSTNNVVRYVIHERHIHRLYGHLFPEGGISADEWKTHLHPDDKEETVRRFLQMVAGETDGDEFYYRWNFNFSGGEPTWGYMHNVSVVEYQPGMKRPTSIISTLRDETEQRQQEERESELTSKYKLIFEHSIVGLSFYTPDGWLLDSNKIMREICHFDGEVTDSFFSKANLFDMAPFSECVDRNNVEEL